MEKIRITTFVILFLVSFVAIYISLETQHKAQVLENQVNELKIEQEKINYLIENQPDTIIVNAYVGFNQKTIQKR